MEKLSKSELVKVIEDQRTKLTRYEGSLKDVVTAYKSLVKEKKALEDSLKVLNSGKLLVSPSSASSKTDESIGNKNGDQKPSQETSGASAASSDDEEQTISKISDIRKEDAQNGETHAVKLLQTQLATLTNSLSTLSIEKLRMEAGFQADRKLLRQEKEKCDEMIRELQEKLENCTRQHKSELEAIKSKLSMERREREKDQNNQSAVLRELQKLVTLERQAKEHLEAQVLELRARAAMAEQKISIQEELERKLKDVTNELEATRSRLKNSETTAQKASPALVQLRAEMADLKQQHIIAIQEEQNRSAEAEERARRLAAIHEERVANLESRLAELSASVGSYDRLRQQDQVSIQRLKEHIAQLAIESVAQKSGVEEKDSGLTDDSGETEEVEVLLRRFLALREQLIAANQRTEKPIDLDAVLLAHSGDLNRHFNLHRACRDDAEQLRQEIQRLRQKQKESSQYSSHYSRSKEGAEGEMLKVQVRSLQERVRMLNGQLEQAERTEHDLQAQLDHVQQQLKTEQESWREKVSALEAELRARGLQLEQQLSLQRERSLALLEDKEQEIRMLKSSFRKLLVPKNQSSEESEDLNLQSSEDLSGHQETRIAQDESRTEKSSTDIQVDGLSGILLGTLSSTANTAVQGNNFESPHILHYAHELARRDVDITNLRKAKYRLECSVRDIQKLMVVEQTKHAEEVQSLKATVERLQRYQSREGANLEYLKNVVLSFLESSSPSSKRHMLNAIAAVLKFSDTEVDRVSRHSSNSWWYYSQ